MEDDSKERVARRFEAVIGPHIDALFRAGMRLTRSHEDAEDLVQDVALRAFPELKKLELLEAPGAWLLRVQYRIFVDGFRRRVRSPVQAFGDAVEPETTPSENPGPEELMEECMRSRRLARVWTRLDRRQRALLALHAEGYTLAELEQITGLTRNALSVRLHRARARLASLIRNESSSALRLVGMES